MAPSYEQSKADEETTDLLSQSFRQSISLFKEVVALREALDSHDSRASKFFESGSLKPGASQLIQDTEKSLNDLVNEFMVQLPFMKDQNGQLCAGNEELSGFQRTVQSQFDYIEEVKEKLREMEDYEASAKR